MQKIDKWLLAFCVALMLIVVVVRCANGKMKDSGCGAAPTVAFVQLGKEALNPETQMTTTQKKYESRITDPDFVAAYVSKLNEKCMPFEKESRQYFTTQKEEDLSNKRNWELIKNTVNNMDSREFKYLETHQADFEKLYDVKGVEQKISQVYEGVLISAIYKDKSVGYEAEKTKLQAKKSALAVKAVAYADMAYCQQKGNWNNYVDAATDYIQRYEPDNGSLLNNVAYTFYANVSDKMQLTKALEWAKKSVDLKEDGANLDTYASLLFKTGNKTAAIEKEKKAIALAKASGDETMAKELAKTLRQFESK
jgi:hypothetical protein